MPDAPIYIHLRPQVATLPVSASHWFGYPALPPGVDLPTVVDDGDEYALTLVAQINLADLPPSALPKSGMLLFFADIAYYAGDWDEPAISMHPSDNRVCRVIYIPADQVPLLQNCQERYFEQDEAQAIPLSFSVKQRPTLDEPQLQLLGTTSYLEWETWPEPCEGWQLLLMMDSMEGPDYNYNFVDCGVLCFIIDPADLKKHDCTNVRAIILST